MTNNRIISRHLLKAWIAGAKCGLTIAIKKTQAAQCGGTRVGHMKNDRRLGRNFLKGTAGDAMNAILCGAGYKLAQDSAPIGAFVCSFGDQS
ncbi:hypothetical protein SAMN05428952_103024 [Nitrosomonas sp. Nm132]|nr:hypothetical protein SAMN05428952_103024 [Nitrosomonas sp. Nm132]